MKKVWHKIGELIDTFIIFFKSSEMSLSSIAVAYYLLISIFPVLLIIGNALPFFKINVQTVLNILKENMPEQLYNGISPVVDNLLGRPNTGLLSLSVLVALWTFSKTLSSLQMAMNKAYEVRQHRDFIISRMIGLVTGLAVFLILYLVVLLLTFGRFILNKIYEIFNFGRDLYLFLNNLTFPALILVAFFSLMLLYFFLPNVKIPKVRYILPGTIFSTFVLVFLTNGIARYVDFALKSLNDFKVVGSLVIFALMLWFIFIAKVLIFGAILNAVYQKTKLGKIEARRGEVIDFIKGNSK